MSSTTLPAATYTPEVQGNITEWKNPSYIQLVNNIESPYQHKHSAEPNCPFTLR